MHTFICTHTSPHRGWGTTVLGHKANSSEAKPCEVYGHRWEGCCPALEQGQEAGEWNRQLGEADTFCSDTFLENY